MDSSELISAAESIAESVAPVATKVNGWALTLSIILATVGIILSIVVLLQQGKSAGLSGAISGGNSDTFVSRNKNRTLEGKLNTLTKILAAVFIVGALVLYYVLG